MNKEKLIEWCWTHLQFNNCPENWEDTYIIDILNGYNGDCHDNKGNALTYRKIRAMFEEPEEDEEDEK